LELWQGRQRNGYKKIFFIRWVVSIRWKMFFCFKSKEFTFNGLMTWAFNHHGDRSLLGVAQIMAGFFHHDDRLTLCFQI
jgi:hypothetical protein